jgi:hypothetical protein
LCADAVDTFCFLIFAFEVVSCRLFLVARPLFFFERCIFWVLREKKKKGCENRVEKRKRGLENGIKAWQNKQKTKKEQKCESLF